MQNSNFQRARRIIEFARTQGVVDFCVCAGARNSPFIVLLDENKEILNVKGQIFHFFEERSAAFFALGRAQQSQRPIAIITTSGTASSELLSATIEAFYSQTPLLLITADRPPNYRGSGAPQAIEQLGLFNHYTLPTLDLYEDLTALETVHWNQQIPLHLNVCFLEPLLEFSIPPLAEEKSPSNRPTKLKLPSPENLVSLEFFRANCKQPLFIIGGLKSDEKQLVINLLQGYPGAYWIESLSGLRGHPALEKYRIQSGDRFLQYLLSHRMIDGVIRVGAIPTTRLWRDLEEQIEIPVLSLSTGPWTGLARPSLWAPLSALAHVIERFPMGTMLSNELQKLDASLRQESIQILEASPLSELSMVRQLSNIVKNQPLYLGNSLPVREWDAVAQAHAPSSISGNRGANGIDGQLSTFFGWMPSHSHSWCLLGDLTTLYDLSAPWITTQLETKNWTVVIMNNGGGQIFKPMFERDVFLNRHTMDFKNWAQMWNLSYWSTKQPLDTLPLAASQKPPHILELQPSEAQTLKVREEFKLLWQKNLR